MRRLKINIDYKVVFQGAFLLMVSTSMNAQNFVLNTTDGLPDLGRSAVVWADFNNDSRLDVAMTGVNHVGTKEAGIYLNNGDGTFSNSGAGLTPVSDGNLATSDYNHDGLMDLLLTGSDEANVKNTKLYKNNGSNVFTAISTSFEGVASGGASFIDLTNDGMPDVIVCGVNNTGTRSCVVYQNNGGDSFVLKTSEIAGASNGSLLVADFNNDSYDDVLITGLNTNSQRMTKVYRNNRRGAFKAIDTILPKLRSGAIASADINADGYLDLLISGSETSSTNKAQVYLNNGGEGFVLLKTLASVTDSGASWGDFNNDGRPDLALLGFNNPDLKATLFTNASGNDLVDAGTVFPGASNGTFTWADYNRDSKLDLLLNGYSVSGTFNNLYTNNTSNANTAPGVPANLTYTAYSDSVVLKWDAPVDAETNSQGLSYDLYIGTTPGSMDIMSPLSDKGTGLRKVAAGGKVHGRTLALKGLAEGVYYWSVQAIDPSFGSSSFASEKTFVSCNTIAITGTNTVCYNTAVSLKAGTASDVAAWYSIKNPSVIIGSSIDLVRTITQKDTLFVKVTKALGCTVNDTIIVNTTPLPSVSLGSDKTACVGDQVLLNATTSATIIRWYEKNTSSVTLGTGNALQVKMKHDTTLVAEVKDTHQCINTDTIKISPKPLPLASLGADREICFNASTQFSAGAVTDSVNWFSQKKGLLLKGSLSYTFKVTEDDIIQIDIYNKVGCVSHSTTKVNVVLPPPVDAGENKLICNNQKVTIGKESNTPGLRFVWEPSASLSSANVSNPFAQPVADTQYILHVFNSHNCESKDTVMVYLNQASTVNMGGDKVICLGEKVELGGQPTVTGSTLPYSYYWFPAKGLDDVASANPQASPVSNTLYGLQIKAGECIIDTSYVKVNVNSLPVIKAGEDVIASKDEPVTLHAQGGITYSWSPEELFDDHTLSDPIVMPHRVSTTYVVKGTDANGCQGTDTVKVTLRTALFVPTLFTPNGDGNNDYFRAHGFGIESITLKIYDRWGRLLFTSSELEKGWDGRVNGLEAEPGNYVWTVQGHYFDGNPLRYNDQYTGTFQLLR